MTELTEREKFEWLVHNLTESQHTLALALANQLYKTVVAKREVRDKDRKTLFAAYDAQAARIAELEAVCRDARSALESLPADTLGVAYRVECAPDAEGGVMTWPIRDELVDKINRALELSKEATDGHKT